ncbi:hypothetical protein V6N11_009174 [Hibiscus sabdariffa]|uniref:Uncharacterized protein n=1 Tax=Hibiscus sabdariffa TaxID=183260 RepID=A0ABR2PPY8_9ROSI
MVTERLLEGSVAPQIPDLYVDMGANDMQITSMDEDVCELNVTGSVTEDRDVTNELSKYYSLEKFGPWLAHDSGKFSVLANLDRDLGDIQEPSIEAIGVEAASKVLPVLNGGVEANMSPRINVEVRVPEIRPSSTHRELVHGSGLNAKELHVNKNVLLERVDVASSERIAPARVSLNPKAHMDVLHAFDEVHCPVKKHPMNVVRDTYEVG